MQLQSYLAFKGNCEEAINFYKDVFDGEVVTLMRFKDAPKEVMSVEDAYKEQIMHVTLKFQDCILMASDYIHEQPFVNGNNYSISVNVKDEEEASAIFTSLAEGGFVAMPFEDAFWGGKFGMLIDQFGVQWMVSSEHKPD